MTQYLGLAANDGVLVFGMVQGQRRHLQNYQTMSIHFISWQSLGALKKSCVKELLSRIIAAVSLKHITALQGLVWRIHGSGCFYQIQRRTKGTPGVSSSPGVLRLPCCAQMSQSAGAARTPVSCLKADFGAFPAYTQLCWQLG